MTASEVTAKTDKILNMQDVERNAGFVLVI